MYINPWIYQGKEFFSEDIGEYYGFVYLLTNQETGRMYIGKKFFYQTKTRQVKKKKKRYKIESDWQLYYGSNESYKQDVAVYGIDTEGAGKIVIQGYNEDLPPETFVVSDTREGWVDYIGKVIEHCIYGKGKVVGDVSQVRPEGAAISGEVS